MTTRSDREREELWRDLIRSFDPRLRAYCRTLRCSDDDAEDILWDVWQEATASESNLKASSDPWSILQLLARRACAARVRTWRRERPLDDENLSVETSDDDPALENRFALRIWSDRLLGGLPEKQRLAIDFRFRWGWPYWAVAAAIDTAEATARVHVARGLRRLRSLARRSPPPRAVLYSSLCKQNTWENVP